VSVNQRVIQRGRI